MFSRFEIQLNQFRSECEFASDGFHERFLPTKPLKRHRFIRLALAGIATAGQCWFSPPTIAEGIPEPGIAFYGRIYNRNGHDYIVKNIPVDWTLAPIDSSEDSVSRESLELPVTTTVSYFAFTPFETVLEGMEPSQESLTLPYEQKNYQATATLIVPGSETEITLTPRNQNNGRFPHIAQNKGRLIRIDFELNDPGPDTDQDGMPDLWEWSFGLDASDPDDASEDEDMDGIDNWVEYRDGTHPTRSLQGDVNQDGEINIRDIIRLISHFQAQEGNPSGIALPAPFLSHADPNEDGTIDNGDLTSLEGKILN